MPPVEKQGFQEIKSNHQMLVASLVVCVAVAAATAKQLNVCRACEKLAEEIDRRLERTASRSGEKITVGHRFGPNGESIHKKIIDYADSYTLSYPRITHGQLVGRTGF